MLVPYSNLHCSTPGTLTGCTKEKGTKESWSDNARILGAPAIVYSVHYSVFLQILQRWGGKNVRPWQNSLHWRGGAKFLPEEINSNISPPSETSIPCKYYFQNIDMAAWEKVGKKVRKDNLTKHFYSCWSTQVPVCLYWDQKRPMGRLLCKVPLKYLLLWRFR